jgi:hypothetical protein
MEIFLGVKNRLFTTQKNNSVEAKQKQLNGFYLENCEKRSETFLLNLEFSVNDYWTYFKTNKQFLALSSCNKTFFTIVN